MSLLHTLSPSAASRAEVLNTIASFWRRNPQFHLITITKFLHYRLVNSGDVVAWIFSSSSAVDDPQNGWCNIDHWDHLTATIKAIKARVGSAKWRLSELRQIEEKKAVERATGTCATFALSSLN
jgi:nuclear cap-binding protein subunit 1